MTDLTQTAQTSTDVKAFLADLLQCEPESLQAPMRLRQDLGLDGADAEEVIEAFALRFDVDISLFRMNDYFGPEAGINPVWSFLLYLSGNAKPLKTLTIADLVTAAAQGFLKG